MGIANKIKEYEDKIGIELFQTCLNKLKELNQTFQKRVQHFIEDFNKIIIEKNINKDLIQFNDPYIFLKGVGVIDFQMSFLIIKNKPLSFCPLVYISFQDKNKSIKLEEIIPNILEFSNKLDIFRFDCDIVHAGDLVLGKKREVPKTFEFYRFMSAEEFKDVVNKAEELFNENIDLFISDLEDFVVKSLYENYEIEDFQNDVEHEKKYLLINEIATNLILKEFNKNDFDDEDDFNTTKNFSILNDIDIEYLSKNKTGVLEIINAYFFDIKDDLIEAVEEASFYVKKI